MTATLDCETQQQPHPEPPPAAPAAVLPPAPEEIDQVIAEYESALRLVKAAEDTMAGVKNRLVFLVDSFGQVPPHAEQSKRLAGRHNVATVTRGTSVQVNGTAVATFQAYLAEQGYPDLFSRFYAAQTKHVLIEGARDVLKTLTLPRRVEEKIAALFGKSFDVKSKSPALKVEMILPERPVRKPRGKKAA